MHRYIARRLLHSLLVVFLALTAVFFMVRLAGDPVMLFLPTDVRSYDIEEFRERLGFNDPLHVQYLRFLSQALRGDFGDSLRHKAPALPLVVERIPATAELAVAAIALIILVAIPAGVTAAVRRNSLFDQLGLLVTVLGQSVPGFWLGLMLIYLLSVQLQLLPTGGRGSLAHLIMPAITLAAYGAARIARLTRSAVLEVLGQDYIRTARAKGLSERVIIYRHALKNAAIPIITLLGLEMSQLLGGAVVTETIFSWPGVGRFIVQALLNRDFPVVMVGVFLTSVIYTTMNLIVDTSYAWLNPRIRYE